MTALRKCLLALMCLQLATPALAGGRVGPSRKPKSSPRARATASLSDADRYARRCQSHSPDRTVWPQGTLLWGTSRKNAADERSSVLVAVDFGRSKQGGVDVGAIRLEAGHLVAAPASRPAEGAPPTSGGVVGAVLPGVTSDGQPVEVAICGAEPAAEDHEMVWYRLEVWDATTGGWVNPCVATGNMPDPRALAVGGLWDASGAHHDAPGKLTFACENGAITKCIRWGYKPWATHAGRSLADVHQACTRMARADYCGDGRSHTREETAIDMYDALGMLARAKEATGDWDPARASFEAAWMPDGASCLARTRHGQPVAAILKECPGRFQAEAVELGDGDLCTVRRADASAGVALLRNRSYGGEGSAPAGAGRK